MKCPDCKITLINPQRCDNPDCGWEKYPEKKPVVLKCERCGSKEVYKKNHDIWLCYEHTARQHRDFVHNMNDYLVEHKNATNKEAWLSAMQFEKYKLDESYFDTHSKKRGQPRHNAEIRFDDLEDRTIFP